MRALAVLVVACLALVACGSGDEARDGGRAAPETAGAELTVTVRPEGEDGPIRRRTIECERLGTGGGVCSQLSDLTPRGLAAVPPDNACTQIYGGPAVARVRGELRGKAVEARFSRENGCEIDRWERNRALLGRVPRGPQP